MRYSMYIYLCQYVKILQGYLSKEHHMMPVLVSLKKNNLSWNYKINVGHKMKFKKFLGGYWGTNIFNFYHPTLMKLPVLGKISTLLIVNLLSFFFFFLKRKVFNFQILYYFILDYFNDVSRKTKTSRRFLCMTDTLPIPWKFVCHKNWNKDGFIVSYGIIRFPTEVNRRPSVCLDHEYSWFTQK